MYTMSVLLSVVIFGFTRYRDAWSFICSKIYGCLALGSDGGGYGPLLLGFEA